MKHISNLFHDIDAAAAGEAVSDILKQPNIRIERIVSHGEASPPGHWYDQEEAEWVLVLAGSAGLVVDGEAREIILHKGDHLYIPPHQRHRVVWTDARETTIWLAVFWRA